MRRGFITRCAIVIVTIFSVQGGKVILAEPNNSNVSSRGVLDEDLMFDAELSSTGKIEIEGKKGVEFSVPVNMTQLPIQHTSRSIEVVVNIPNEFEVKNVVLDKSQIEVENIDYYMDKDNTLRIALTNTGEKTIVDKGTTLQRKVLEVVLVPKNDMKAGEKYNIELKDFIVRCTDDWDKSYAIISRINTIEVSQSKEKEISARELYVSNGNNVIPENFKAIEIQLSDYYSDIYDLDYKKIVNNETVYAPGFYSVDLSEKNKKHTYLLLIDKVESLENIENPDNYNIVLGSLDHGGKHLAEITFGDIDGNGIDAQDAIGCINIWLRKVHPYYGEMLISNVNADGEITTRDAIDIVDNYISKKEFKILSK